MKTTNQAHCHAVNLLLADQMARVYGLSRGAAIQRCARVVKRETKDQGMYALADGLIKVSNDRRINAIEKFEQDMRQEGLL